MRSVWSDLNSNVICTVNNVDKVVSVEGPLGVVEQSFKGSDIVFKGDGSFLIKSKSSLGYFIGRLKSLFEGVSSGYFIELEISGRGYRFINLVDQLLIKLGYMHYIGVKHSKGVRIVGSRTKVIIFGLDLEEVHRVAGIIRGFKKLDVYKGKGVVPVGEKLTLKVGKKS